MTETNAILLRIKAYDGGNCFPIGDGSLIFLNFKLLDESQVLLRVPRKDNIYSVDLKSVVPTKGLTCLIAKATIDESNLWHRRLGHINFKNMNKLMTRNLVRGLPSKFFKNDHCCVACQKGKQHKASYKAKLVNSISKPLHMLHMDLFGPTNVKSLMKKSYCLVVTDDFSRFSWVFFLATKDETSGILKTFITEIENQLDHKVKVIRCDNGTEFKNSQNDVAERKNRTLIEATRTMLVDSKLPTTFWAEAVNTACYVLNRVLVIKPHNKTPYELIRGRPPLIDFMKPFGCPVTILNTRDHLGKFDEKADEGYFIGYSVISKAMRVFNKRTRIVEKTLNIRFLENSPNEKGNGPDWLFDIDSLIFGNDYDDVEEEVDMNNVYTSYTASDDPFTKFLKDHPQEQFTSLGEQITKTFKIVCLPVFSLKRNPRRDKWETGTKWVFRNKKDERGILVKNKARIVAQGYTQEEGIDYDEVFAPLERIEAIRLFMAYASFNGFVVYQMDVKSAFLYVKIEEEVYVCQPLGFEDPNFPNKVYKVEKALYGLHQAPRAWYETLSTYLLDNGFHRGQIDKTLFIKRHKDDILLVQVYVDDIIFGSTKKELSTEFEKLMHDKFQMSSMGELTFFLGLQVQQKSDGIFISQDKYVAEILKKFDFATVKTASTPIETNKALVKDKEAEAVDVHLYISMIRSLMYLTASRPDIMFAVCACASFQITPKNSHLHALKRIFRYLKGQSKLGLWYPRDSPFDLIANPQQEAKHIEYLVGDEAVHKELGDRMERAATTASSLEAEQDSELAMKDVGMCVYEARLRNGNKEVKKLFLELNGDDKGACKLLGWLLRES
ncbi:retrovirus-related pol polyprotein from transposon TNT 1-94 [Tanacetum coccineum]